MAKIKFNKIIRPAIYILVALIHVGAIFFIKMNIKNDNDSIDENAMLIKLVDVVELEPIKPSPDTIEVASQPTSAENIIEVEEKVTEVNDSVGEIEYIQQHLISKIPDIPTNSILGKIEYPAMALRQGIEAVVYLELYIDKAGYIRRIEVLQDPGFGFAEAAIEALDGIRCSPAEANGSPVAVRFRYPIRFVLK